MIISKFLIKLKDIILSDKILKSIILVTGGTAIGQVINIIAQPFITRIFSPNQYGILTVYSSLFLIFRFCTLRYEMAIPIPKKDEDGINLVAVTFLVLSCSVTILTVILFLFGDEFLNYLNASELTDFWVFIPLGIFIEGIYLILVEWMYRKKHFKLVSKKTIIQSLGGNLTKIGLGLLNFGAIGLIIGKIMSVGSASVPLFYAFKKENKAFFSIISWDRIKENAVRYKDFPLFQTPSTLSLHLRNQLPIIFLAPLFGSQVVGHFGLANQIIKLPMTLIGQSVMSVFFAEVASLGKENPEKIKELSNKLFKQLFLLGLIPLLILVTLGPWIFGLIFGSDWVQAGVFARILSFYVFANFVFSPISRIYEVFERQKEKMYIDFGSLLILTFVFISANYFDLGVYTVIICFAVIMFTVYFVTYLLSIRILNLEIKALKNDKM